MHAPSPGVPTPPPPVVCRFGDFEFVEADRLLIRNGARVSLTPKAIDTLAILINARSEIIRAIEASLAGAQAQLGNGETMRWLRWAADGGFPCQPWFEIDPLLEPVRKDPAFATLMREVRMAFPNAGGRP